MKTRYCIDLTKSVNRRDAPNIKEEVYCWSKDQALGHVLASHNCRYMYDDMFQEIDSIVTEYVPKSQRSVRFPDPEPKKFPTPDEAEEILESLPGNLREPLEKMYKTMKERKNEVWEQSELDF